MGKTYSKPLAARHGRGTTWARHGHGMLWVNRPYESYESKAEAMKLGITAAVCGVLKDNMTYDMIWSVWFHSSTQKSTNFEPSGLYL